jgi:hypothetical protein
MPDEIAVQQEAVAPAEVIAASAIAGPDAGETSLSVVGSNPVDPGVEVERFAVAVAFAPSSANDDNRTIDAVWYTGAKVPRFDWRTGEEYDLILSMKGLPVRPPQQRRALARLAHGLRRRKPDGRCSARVGRKDDRQGYAAIQQAGFGDAPLE